MEALTSGSEVRKREFFYANKNCESNEKETKERMDMFMVEKSEKKSRLDWIGINTRKNEIEENKPRLAYLTTLPILTKLLDSEGLPHVVTPSAWIRLAC